MVPSLEVAPHQRKLSHPPGPQPCPGMSSNFPSLDEPMPSSSSIWSSALLVSLATLTARRVPPSLR
jgi:hypothetical protein